MWWRVVEEGLPLAVCGVYWVCWAMCVFEAWEVGEWTGVQWLWSGVEWSGWSAVDGSGVDVYLVRWSGCISSEVEVEVEWSGVSGCLVGRRYK